MSSSDMLRLKGEDLKRKFEEKWDPFTRSLAGHPKTALATGFVAGAIVGGLIGRPAVSFLLSFIGL